MVSKCACSEEELNEIGSSNLNRHRPRGNHQKHVIKKVIKGETKKSRRGWSESVPADCTFGWQLSVAVSQLWGMFTDGRCRSLGLTCGASSRLWNENSLRSIISCLPQELALPMHVPRKTCGRANGSSLGGPVPHSPLRKPLAHWRHEAL